MMSQVDPVQETLIANNENFRQLYEEHLEYKEKLVSIRQKAFLSQDDEVEMKRIKLHKLSLKDRMEAIRREYVASA